MIQWFKLRPVCPENRDAVVWMNKASQILTEINDVVEYFKEAEGICGQDLLEEISNILDQEMHN